MDFLDSQSLNKGYWLMMTSKISDWLSTSLIPAVKQELTHTYRLCFQVQNKELEWPSDFTSLLVWTVICGIVHQLTTRYILRPMARRSVDEATTPGKSKKTISTQDKFLISSWRFVVYLLLVIYGVYVMFKMEWFTDGSQWFENWPNIPMEKELKWYYWISYGNYMYSMIIMFFEIKQKDFMQMICHHVTTLGLLWFSYTMGFHRVGTVILLLHDSSDPLLELAKSCLYVGWQTAANYLFTAFAVVFTVTRLILYPTFVITSCWVYGRPHLPYLITIFFIVLLLTLQGLHVFWAKLILKVAQDAWKGDVKGDIRDKDHKIE